MESRSQTNKIENTRQCVDKVKKKTNKFDKVTKKNLSQYHQVLSATGQQIIMIVCHLCKNLCKGAKSILSKLVGNEKEYGKGFE